jgi:mutator protein MutT
MRQKVAGDVLERLLAVMEQKKREMVLLQGKPREATASMSARNVSVLILYKADGKILLQHRSKDAPTLPDHWSFFGGGVEEGESPEQAVRREAVEELGYQLASPRLFSVKQIAVEKRELTLHVFVERYDGGLLTLGEGQAMGWFLPDATKDLLILDGVRAIIEAVGEALRTEI